MNTSPHPETFFSKPSFRAPIHRDGLTLSARRALAAFEIGHQFSAGSLPPFASEKSLRSDSGTRDAQEKSDASGGSELERLLNRNLLPRLSDEPSRARPPTDQGPNLIELTLLGVIAGVVIWKAITG